MSKTAHKPIPYKLFYLHFCPLPSALCLSPLFIFAHLMYVSEQVYIKDPDSVKNRLLYGLVWLLS